MKRAQIGILLALVLALGTWIVTVELPKMSLEALGDRLVDLDPAAVEELTFTYPDGRVLAARRAGSDWVLTAPGNYPADGEQIDRFLDSVAGLIVERRLSPEEAGEPVEYGVAGGGSTALLHLGIAGGQKPVEIVVGKTTPVGFSAFVRRSDSDEIAIVPLLFHTNVKKELFDLRRKNVFDFDPGAVMRITVERPDQPRVLVARGESDWSQIEPAIEDADRDRIDDFLRHVVQARALAFVEPSDTEGPATGLDAPATKVTIDFDDGSSVAFRLGNSDETPPAGRWLGRDGTNELAKIGPEFADPLLLETSAFLDPRLFRCDPRQVRRIFVGRAGRRPFVLIRNDEGLWSFEPYDGIEVDQKVADRFVDGLLSMKGENAVAANVDSVEAQARFALDDPALEFDVTDGDGIRCAAVLGGALIGDAEESVDYFVQRRGSPTVFRLEPHEWSHLDFFAADFEVRAEAEDDTAAPAAE
jgi:hypothetical protein